MVCVVETSWISQVLLIYGSPNGSSHALSTAGLPNSLGRDYRAPPRRGLGSSWLLPVAIAEIQKPTSINKHHQQASPTSITTSHVKLHCCFLGVLNRSQTCAPKFGKDSTHWTVAVPVQPTLEGIRTFSGDRIGKESGLGTHSNQCYGGY